MLFEDTFMPLWCKIVGHKKYIPDSNEPKKSLVNDVISGCLKMAQIITKYK